MQKALADEGVDTHLVRLDPNQPSNRNFVLWFGQDRTILVRHEIYDYHWPHLSPREVPGWLYLSSVGSDAAEYYDQIVAWLAAESSVRFAFQPGTFQIAQGTQAMRGLYGRADVLVCNREEAVEIGGGDHSRVGDLLERLHLLGPRIVVVTDGPEGAYASDGSQRYRVPAYPDPCPPKERTGAGRRVRLGTRRRARQGLPFGGGAFLGPDQCHERGPRGRLTDGAAQRDRVAQVPRGRTGVVRRHHLVTEGRPVVRPGRSGETDAVRRPP